MNKQKLLQEIAKEIENCKICKTDTSGKAVPGEGDPDADIIFIGEAPGKNEAREGRPFIGRSGKLLRQTIRDIGLTEDEVFITSPVKYLPDRGTPTPKQIAHGRTHLMKQFDVIQPKLIVLMGSTAIQGVLEEKVPVMKRHGDIVEKEGKKYFITLHPAAAIRFQKLKKIFLEDFQKLKTLASSFKKK